VSRKDVLAVVACAALGFVGARAVRARGAVKAAPVAEAAVAAEAPTPSPMRAPRVSPEDVRAMFQRQLARAAATPRSPEIPPTPRQVLTPIFGADELEQALLVVASGSANGEDAPALREVLRRDPRASLAAIENVMGRLPDPTTGTGPAHELLLRVATTSLGLDPATRLDLLRRELTRSEADDGRPHRPLAALGIVVATESAAEAKALYEDALAHQKDPAVRDELTLTFEAAYPNGV
jgi:hypothetical protein